MKVKNPYQQTLVTYIAPGFPGIQKVADATTRTLNKLYATNQKRKDLAQDQTRPSPTKQRFGL